MEEAFCNSVESMLFELKDEISILWLYTLFMLANWFSMVLRVSWWVFSDFEWYLGSLERKTMISCTKKIVPNPTELRGLIPKHPPSPFGTCQKRCTFAIKWTFRPPNELIFHTGQLEGSTGQKNRSTWPWLNFGVLNGGAEVAPWRKPSVIQSSQCYLSSRMKSRFCGYTRCLC